MHVQKYEYGTGNVKDIIMTILCEQIFIFLNLFRPFFPSSIVWYRYVSGCKIYTPDTGIL